MRLLALRVSRVHPCAPLGLWGLFVATHDETEGLSISALFTVSVFNLPGEHHWLGRWHYWYAGACALTVLASSTGPLLLARHRTPSQDHPEKVFASSIPLLLAAFFTYLTFSAFLAGSNTTYAQISKKKENKMHTSVRGLLCSLCRPRGLLLPPQLVLMSVCQPMPNCQFTIVVVVPTWFFTVNEEQWFSRPFHVVPIKRSGVRFHHCCLFKDPTKIREA